MLERFRQLARREQIVLITGAVLVVWIIGWRFVWAPLDNGAAELSESVADNARLVVDLQRAAELSTGPGTTLPTAATQSLVTLTTETARSIGLDGVLTRRSPDGNDAINVSFRDAPFDIFVSWLASLEREYGLRVVIASTSPTGEPGFVDGQIRLER
jgi:type II secretory pathway component PulM